MKRNVRYSLFIGLPLIFLAAALMGCQAMFTFSPLSFLQRDPATLTPEQKLTYGADALASGDPVKMLSAYSALQGLIAAGSAGPEVLTLAAHLGIELSGVPAFFTAVIQSLASGGSVSTLQDFVTTNASTLQLAYLAEAATYLQDAEQSGTLTATDYLFGSAGLVVQSAQASGIDLTDPTSVETMDLAALDLSGATSFLEQGMNELALPQEDPTLSLLQQFSDYLNNPSP